MTPRTQNNGSGHRAPAVPDPLAPGAERGAGRGGLAGGDAAQVPARWRGFYDQLVRQRDALIDGTLDLRDKAREVTPDPIQDGLAETATESYQRDQLLGAMSLDQDILSDVNLALSKIEDGTYSVCKMTGQEIPIERLEAIPWARCTVEAQAAREAAGEAPKSAVGPSNQSGGSSLPLAGSPTPRS